MNEQRGPARDTVLREISWRDLCHWLILVRSFRMSIHPLALTIAFLAVIATPFIWRVGTILFVIPTPASIERQTLKEGESFSPKEIRLAEDVQQLTRFPHRNKREPAEMIQRLVSQPVQAIFLYSPVVHNYQQLSVPLWNLYRHGSGWRVFAFYLFGVLGTLAIWGFAGGMIVRMAVMDFGRDEQVGLVKAYQLTLSRWFDFFTAPLYPILGTVVIALLSMVVGWLLNVNALVPVAGILWLFVLIGGAISAFMMLWLFLGWPLMWPAIAAEETGDAFDAMSRSMSYLTGKPLNFLFYVAVAALLGLISWIFVEIFCELVLHATHWSVSWGCDSERLNQLWHGSEVTAESTVARGGMAIIRFIEGVLSTISESFAFAYFFVSTSAIYLLMRQDVDHTEFDEVWNSDDQTRYPLPTLKTDEAKVPVAPAAETTPTAPEKPAEIDQNQAE